MSFTFNANLSDAVSQVRQRIGDTASTGHQIEDETITAYETQGLTVLATARRLCLDLAAKWATAAMITLDDQRSDFTKTHQHYLDMAKAIEAEMRPAVTDAAAAGSAIMVTGCDEPCAPWWG